MADTAQRAGIDIPITISNIEGLEKVHNQVTNLLSQVPKLKESFSGLNLKLDLGNKAETQIAELNHKLGTTNELLNKANTDVRSVSSKFSNATDTANNFGNKVKEASGDTKKLSENSSQNNEQFKKAISIISEMSGDIKKVVDYQKQQTSAVRETNTSLKDVASLSEKIYNGQGRQTDAIRTTNTQLGQTRLAINEIKNNQNEFTNAVSKSSNQANKLKDDFSKVNEKANMKPTLEKNTEAVKGLNTAGEETHKKFSGVKDVFTGTFAGTMISNGIMNITNSLGEQVKAGYDDAKAAETFQDKFKNMGASTKEIDQLGVSIKQIKENSNISGGAVTALTQKFYGMTGSAQKTQELTKGVGSLSDALHLSGAQSDAFAGGLSRIEASGKVTGMSLGRLEKQAPGLSSAMAKASGMSQKSFNDLVNSGKMTTDQFNDMLTKAGGNFDANAKKFNSTTDGATHHMQTAFADTRKALMKPLVKVSSTGLQELSKILDNPATQKATEQLGKSIGSVASNAANVIKVVTPHMKDITSIMNSLFSIAGTIGSSVWNYFKDIISAIAGVINDLSGKSKKAGDNVHGIANAFKEVAKHKETLKIIGGLIATAFAVKKLSDFVNGIKKVNSTLKITIGIKELLNTTNPFGWVALAIGAIVALGATFKVLYDKWKPFHDLVNKTANFLKKGFVLAVKAVGKAIGGLVDVFKNVFGKIGKIIGDVTKKISGSKEWKFFVKEVKRTVDIVVSVFKGMGKIICNVLKSIGGLFKSHGKDATGFGKTFKSMSKVVVKVMESELVSHIKKSLKVIGDILHTIGDLFKDAFNVIKKLFDIWADVFTGKWGKLGKDIGGYVKAMWNLVKDLFVDSLKILNDITGGWLGKIFNWFVDIFKGIANFLKGSWDTIKSIWKGATDWIGNMWNGFLSGVKWIWDHTFGALIDKVKDAWGTIKSIWKGATDWIGDLWHGFTDGLKSVWDNTFGALIDKVKNAIGEIHHHMVDIARGVIKPINAMLSGLKEGINWVLDKVGADKISAKWEISMPSYAKGTNDTHPGGLAKVNDGNGSDFREMYKLPNGQIGMFPNKRNLIVNLPKGTSVLNGERSAKISKRLGMPSYASGIGKFFGDVAKNVGGAFKGIWDKGADLIDMADDILKKPSEFLETVFAKFLGGASSNISLASDVITHFPSTVAKAGIKWIKGLINDFGGDAGGSRGDPSGKGVQRWKDTVKRALKANGVEPTDAMVNKWLRQIATESGGNSHAVQGNIGDINNKTGDLAKGLVQVIGSTFRANAFPGHTDIFNGYDNLLAGIHYAIKRYGKGMGPIGNGHGYANGGFVGSHQMIEIAEGNKLEAVVPLTKRNRAFEILRNIFSIMKPSKSEQDGLGLGNSSKNTSTMPGSDFYSPSTNASGEHQDLSVGNSDKETLKELKKANKLNEQMFNAILGLADLSKEQIVAIKDSKVGIDDINKQQGLKFNIANYQHP